MNDVVLSSAVKETILSLNRTASVIAKITQRLATGKDVNSALDQPDNFFASRALNNTAKDFAALLDNIGQNIRVVETAFQGLDSVENLIEQARIIAQTSKEKLLAGENDPLLVETEIDISPQSLNSQILSLDPVAYFPLNDASFTNLGTGTAITTQNDGVTTNAQPLYTNGGTASARFDGGNDRIRVSNSTLINVGTQDARTVELVFNADNVNTRQVLYEEGATVNGLTIYIDNGLLYITAEDDDGANRYADININAPIQAGQTYHVGFTLDPPNDRLNGYLNGELIQSVTLNGDNTFPSHTGGIGIGGVNGGVQFHDGESNTGNGFNFTGNISDVAIHNQVLDAAVFASHANALNASSSLRFTNPDYNNLIDQINQITNDANYRGINLLQGETLRTFFNPDRTSFLDIEGRDFTEQGLGIKRFNFNSLSDLHEIIEQLDTAQEQVRIYTSSLVTKISVLQTRLDFTQETISTHEAGADDLTLDDQNRTAAELLASQIRETLGVTSLGLSAQSQSAILRLF